MKHIFIHQYGFANLIIAIAVLVSLSAIGATYLVLNKRVKHFEPRACTMEAKQCPDGSYVGRTGPACEFAACPSATTQSAEIGVIKNFIAQWNVLQKSIPISPVLGSTTWQVDYFQFIGNNKLLVAFEDGHIMSVAAFGYDANNNFNYINTFKDDYPFTSVKWQEIVKTYSSEQYTVANYVKQITRGTEVVNFNDWTKVPENVFLKQGEDLFTSSTSLTASWKTYRNEKYGFEFKYPPTLFKKEEVRDHELSDAFSFELREKTDEESGWIIVDVYRNYSFSSLDDFLIYIKAQKVYETETTIGDIMSDLVITKLNTYTAYKFNTHIGISSDSSILLLNDNIGFEISILELSIGQDIYNQILSTFKFIEPSNNSTDRRCGNYIRNGVTTEQCATCGDKICESYERCVSSQISGGIATADCGPLNCPEDCQNN